MKPKKPTSPQIVQALIPKLALELGRELIRSNQARKQIRKILRAQKTIKLIDEGTPRSEV